MDLDNLKLFKLAMTRMDWATQRQRVLSQNISNADTPDYRPKDLNPVDFKQVLRGQMAAPVQVARTNPNHLKGTIQEQDKFRDISQRKTFEASPDGNQVVVEEQMQKVSDTRSAYDTAVTLMQANLKMLSIAIKGTP
ncbi:MAG: flagellar basal body rod protein FlgB [Rhodospirillaceae bacterium]|nr:flagellar basal body rod protein FlgB [Rhodospirillaceae bacterium]